MELDRQPPVFTDQEERQGASPVLVISPRPLAAPLWRGFRYFGEERLLDGEPATVIGVMPHEFEFFALNVNANTQYWTPLRGLDSRTTSAARIFEAVARLRPGVEIGRAQAEMDAFAQRLGEFSPDDRGWRIHLQPLDVYVSDQFRTSALTLQGVVAFVLLIACANVAGLLLTQGMTQRRELAVRLALGSSRRRIVRQLMTHSLVLAGAGSILGLALAWWGLQILRGVVPNLPRAFYITPLDSNVLVFTLVVSVLCGLIAGTAPAFHMSRMHPEGVLRESVRSASSGVAHRRLRSAFVVCRSRWRSC